MILRTIILPSSKITQCSIIVAAPSSDENLLLAATPDRNGKPFRPAARQALYIGRFRAAKLTEVYPRPHQFTSGRPRIRRDFRVDRLFHVRPIGST
ncbi:MAG: hypothetical protein C0483_14650 [Pirellula sp.]|nr:hypothetical protein [Pirellula sp.]